MQFNEINIKYLLKIYKISEFILIFMCIFAIITHTHIYTLRC